MLYAETLNKLTPSIYLAVKELFRTAFENQTHENDILLVLENGFYTPEHPEFYRLRRLSPYVIGPNLEGQSEYTQYIFYDIYRNHFDKNRSTFLTNVLKDVKLQLAEEYSIQLEMMVYLKFWESESIIKKLFQLSRLANGLDYDWHFSFSQGIKRNIQNIIRNEIRDTLITTCPNFYSLVNNIYKSQIRNATAHSSFYFLNRRINLTNYNSDPRHHSQISNVPYEDWETTIHSTILLYNEIIRQSNIFRRYYETKANNKHFGLQLRINKTDGSSEKRWYKYLGKKSKWVWYDNVRPKSFIILSHRRH